jgi:hypothetical protein
MLSAENRALTSTKLFCAILESEAEQQMVIKKKIRKIPITPV